MQKCLSLWQPWALIWCLDQPDEKIYETRGPNSYVSYRGPLLIHAAKKQDGEVREAMNSAALRELRKRHGLELEDFVFGAIIGRIDLINCTRMDNMPAPSERERQWGRWEPGRHAYQRGPKPVIFAQPIPYRGQQGIFNVPDDTLSL